MSTVSPDEMGELATWLIDLTLCKAIPDNCDRNLNDPNIKRLMSDKLKMACTNIEIGIDKVGYDFNLRWTVEQLCRSEGVTISWRPTEQDSFGWLAGKLITRKGCFHFV